jgi:hypothetical protein
MDAACFDSSFIGIPCGTCDLLDLEQHAIDLTAVGDYKEIG